MNIPYLAYQAAAAHDRLWAIHPLRAEALATLFATNPQAFGMAFGGSEPDLGVIPQGVAVIQLSGVMSRAGMPCMDSASTIDLERALRAAGKDETIRAVVIHTDSPGGTVAGTGDFAEAIAKVAAVKPVYAYVPDMACSAAYWAISQATEIWASPNATAIGNIGVRTAAIDSSSAAAMQGVKVIPIDSAEFKSIGLEGAPIPEAHLAEMKRQVLDQAQRFESAVMKGRKVSAEKAKGWHDGRWFTADEAKANGLIDHTGSLADLYQKISSRDLASPLRVAVSPAVRLAASAPTPNKPMSKLKDMIALWRGNPEAAKAAGMPDAASIDALEAEANAAPPIAHAGTDPAVLKMIQDAKASAEAAQASAAQQSAAFAATLMEGKAEAFANDLIRPDAKGFSRANPAQRDSLKSLYRAAVIADGGGVAKIENGALVEGQNVATTLAAFKDAPTIQHGDTIPDGDPTEVATFGGGPVTAERKADLKSRWSGYKAEEKN